MKKRRILACALSLSMILSSFTFNTFAQDTDVTASDVAVEATEVVSEEVADTVTSDSSAVVVENDATTDDNQLFALGQFKELNTSPTVLTEGSYTVTPTDDGVSLAIIKDGKGKVTSGEDTIIGYGAEVDGDYDFTLSGTVTVNNLNHIKNSNPQQAGFGIALMDSMYDVKGTIAEVENAKYSSGAFGCFHMEKSSSTSATIGYRSRTTTDGKKGQTVTWEKELVPCATGGSNLGPYEMVLKKRGNLVTIEVDGESFTKEFTSGDLSGTVFPMFFIGREADITVSNMKFVQDTKKVVSLSVEKAPDKTEYLLNEELDTTGMKVIATYDDGSQGEVTDYAITGYDSSSATTQAVKVVKGLATTTFDVTVNPIGVTSFTIKTPPLNTIYYPNSTFSSKGITIDASFEDGSSATYTDADVASGKLAFTLDGVAVAEGDVLPAASGIKEFEVRLVDENFNVEKAVATFKGEFHNVEASALSIITKPEKEVFYVGDEADFTGLTVKLIYPDNSSELIGEDEYTFTGFDSTTEGTKTITVASVLNPELTDTFEITVKKVYPVALAIAEYPQTTYNINEAWNPEGIVVETVLSSTKTISAVEGKDYTIDVSAFDSSKAGLSKVTIIPTNKDFSPITLDITTREQKETVWNSIVFGQSSTGVNAGDPSSEVIVDESTGKVTVKSWHGSGKITGDHDGIAYYYTRVNPEDNFSLTADIYVKGYLGNHPASGAAGSYNVDENHTGQESFGLMARDVIPLETEDGNMTIFSSEAAKDENGEPVGDNRNSAVFASNIAIAGGYSGSAYPTDKTSASYEKNTKLNRINLYARTGVTAIDGGGTKNGPQAISTEYPKAAIYYPSTDAKMSGADNAFNEEWNQELRPDGGDKYRITLERVNVLSDMKTGAITRRGLRAECTYLGPDPARIGETMETYMSDEIMNRIFSVQNSEDAYVGIFAARWAIIDAENIKFSTSDPATDRVHNVVQEEEVVPKLSISSQTYTTVSDYILVVKANNENGGFLTIKRGDEVIYNQMKIGNNRVRLPIKLNENSGNEFVTIYTPSKVDKLSSYEDVVQKFTIYHRTATDAKELYVGPNGVSNAEGTREDPMDLVTAIGYIKPGQTIVMLDGTYKFDERIDIGLANGGYKGNVKSLIADEGANPVIDFGGEGSGFFVAGNYWHISGITVTGSSDNQPGFELGGKNCLVENVKSHDNGGTGFQVSRVSSEQEFFEDWPANNIIRNCEVWNNADSTKINADGFGCKLTVGNGNVFDNCISHHNVDDGWDLYTKLASGAIGEAVLVNCASYENGYKLVDGVNEPYGGGGHNGFKMGGENIFVNHYIKDSMSFKNEGSGSGISSNSNPAQKLRNVVFYDNEGRGVSLYSDKPDEYNYDLKGVISFENGSTDRVGGSLNIDLDYVNHAATDLSTEESNYLMRTGSDSVTPSGAVLDPATMFISTDFEACAPGRRFAQNADGSYNFNGFLQRVEAYEHEAEDAVEMYGCFYNGDAEATTKEEPTTETTTKKKPSSSGGSGSSSSTSKSSKGNNSTKASGKEKIKDIVVTNPNPEVDDVVKPETNVPAGAFSDIDARPWAVEAITALSEAGIINGVGNGKFAPDAKAKRCDFIVMLIKLMGAEGTATDNFADVPAGAYYANAVGIAKELGIATGVGENKFNPTATISRQDMMVLVARALEISGAELNKDTAVLDQFADANAIADYAKPYVAALVNAGVVSGTGNKIEPTVEITRAQMAVLLYNVVVAAAPEEPVEETTEVVEESTEETTEAAEESTEVAEETTETVEESTEEVSEETTEA